jgi:formate dehydrogenase subunit delta
MTSWLTLSLSGSACHHCLPPWAEAALTLSLEPLRMDIHHLVHMANRIGQFFEAMPDNTEAQAGVAQHLQKFWAPPMRLALLAHVQAGGEGLQPLVLQAVQAHAALLQPVQPAQRASAVQTQA